ncbi:MFS transporter [Actinoplanes sp. RD1]|uniref:MFS transporter n=1 Tax=Actinoplanes sp. RD1 TaxID=3064538 RepID=UPI00274208D0|nr:MFS transporter [Actinoplanes sp. RD1]
MELTPVRRGRIATSLAFLLFGAALGTWTARIPAVKQQLGLGDGRLGVALLAFAAGCILGMAVLGRLTDRLGSARVLVPAALLEGLLLAAAGLGGALLVGTPAAGIAGWGLLGAGLSGIAPQVYSAAGNRDPQRAGRALSTVVSIGTAPAPLGREGAGAS